MRFLEKLVIVAVIVLVLFGYFYYKGEVDVKAIDTKLTSRECLDRGGIIETSLSLECKTRKIGDISDLKGQLVCCEPS